MHRDNKTIITAIALLLVAIPAIVLGVKFFSPEDDGLMDVPENYGEIAVDEDGDELLGDVKETYYNTEDVLNENLMFFDKKEADKVGKSIELDVLLPEKELDETVVKKKKLYLIDLPDSDEGTKLRYAIEFLGEHMTGSKQADIFTWLDMDGTVHINIGSSVYTGLMVEYFPIGKIDPACTDFSVTEESSQKSIHLLMQNAKLLVPKLIDTKNGYPDIYFKYINEAIELEGITDANGKVIIKDPN